MVYQFYDTYIWNVPGMGCNYTWWGRTDTLYEALQICKKFHKTVVEEEKPEDVWIDRVKFRSPEVCVFDVVGRYPDIFIYGAMAEVHRALSGRDGEEVECPVGIIICWTGETAKRVEKMRVKGLWELMDKLGIKEY